MAQTNPKGSLSHQLFESPGYSIDFFLLPDELKFLREAIALQIRNRAYICMEQAGLQDYHTVTHHKMWGDKRSRVFPQDVVAEVENFEFLKHVRYDVGEWRISPVIANGKIDRTRNEVYWRIVRPHAETDVAELHADYWYFGSFKDEEGKSLLQPGDFTLKAWIPIECEPGLNGLEVIEDSHHREWQIRNVPLVNNWREKRELLEEPGARMLLPTRPGNVVLFNDHLLHGGAVNRGSKTRISVEITLIFSKQ